MNDKIKAVFFDIDGTLVSFASHAVPESARRAIGRLRERGVKVFISTGRLLRHTEVVSDIEVDGYVSFPRETLDKVFALEEKYGFQAAVMTHDDIYIDRITDRVQSIVDMIHITPSVADLKRIAATDPVLQMCPYVGEELERKIMPELPECVGTRWIDIFMDINMRGIDKSVGARKVMEFYGLTMDEAMAFGDGGNDIPIVRDAAVGVAMGNACDALKAVADYVTEDVDHDGVLLALEHYGLI